MSAGSIMGGRVLWKDSIGGGVFDGRSRTSTGAVQTQQLGTMARRRGYEKTRAGDAMQMARIAFVRGRWDVWIGCVSVRCLIADWVSGRIVGCKDWPRPSANDAGGGWMKWILF